MGKGVKLSGSLNLLLFVLITQGRAAPQSPSGVVARPNSGALRHGIRLQPELDKIDIDAYLKNQKAIKIQVQCLIYDGPCDWVGRWLKPRAAAALLGECLLCTEHQKTQLPKIMNFIQVNFPEEFKIGVKKYLLEIGIEVPPDSSSTTTVATPASSNSTESATAVAGIIESTTRSNANNSTTSTSITTLSTSTTTLPPPGLAKA